MANYDDIFNASQPKESEEKSFTPFDKDEWAAPVSYTHLTLPTKA